MKRPSGQRTAKPLSLIHISLKDTAFDIISLNDNAVLVEGKLYKKNEVVKTIRTDIEGVASTSADLLPYGKFRIVESEAPDGCLLYTSS